MSIAPGPPQIIPYLFYRDVSATLDFLCVAFGFKEEMRHTGRRAAAFTRKRHFRASS